MSLTSIFRKQDIFFARMVEDYRNGLIPNPVYKPYFDWKTDVISARSIPRQEALQILDTVSEELSEYYDRYPDAGINPDDTISDDPWQRYREFGDDCYIVSYLEMIEGQMMRLVW